MDFRIVEFFEDNEGRMSSMRLYSFISLITAIIITFTGGSYEMVLTYLVVAVGGKSTQKMIEDIAANKKEKVTK